MFKTVCYLAGKRIGAKIGGKLHTFCVLLFANEIFFIDFKLTADPVKDYEDIDAENISDPFQVAMYANDIFNHYKEREVG